MSIAVIIEHDRGTLAPGSTEALTAARGFGDDVVAVVCGAEPAADMADELASFGATSVIGLDNDLLTDYGPEAWGAAVTEWIEDAEPELVIASGTDRGNEIVAQASARLDAAFVANVLELDLAEGSALRSQWGGSLRERVSFEADVPLVTVGLHSVEAVPVDDPATVEVDDFAVDIDDDLARTVVRDRVVLSEGITLSTAPVVVGGGRGVGSADGFAPLEELANEVGGKVGCSRAVTNNGWRNHKDQVGQTGTRIAPTIYIASGISGAIQHWVGAMASKHILAINTDPEANMVTRADWAVLGDLHQVIPAITEEIRRRRA